MLAKDKFLNKINLLTKVIFIFVFYYSNDIIAETNESILINYSKKLTGFSALFIQSDGKTIEEGQVYIGNSRVKIKYMVPTKITLVLAKNKAMYVNHDLKEVQYFNPKKNIVKIFFDILKDVNFFHNTKITKNSSNLIVEKKINLEKETYIIQLLYDFKPTALRKIKIKQNINYYEMSFFNHNYNTAFEKNYFSLINPFLSN